jgi:hypothetical protein
MAKQALEGLIGGGALVCTAQDTDTYGRAVARCRTSGVDVGDALVASGWATAFRRYGEDYVAAEARARAARAGIWQWSFQPPEDYRASQQRAAEPRRIARSVPRASTSQRRAAMSPQPTAAGGVVRTPDLASADSSIFFAERARALVQQASSSSRVGYGVEPVNGSREASAGNDTDIVPAGDAGDSAGLITGGPV